MESARKAEEEQGERLSWQDRPVRELARLAWPITVSSLSYSVMTLVSTLLVTKLGSAELAGVGLGGTYAFVLLCFSFGLLRGVKTLVSQAMGAGRPEDVAPYRGAALLTAITVGVVTVALGQVLAEMLVMLAATPVSGEAARTYLSIRILGAPLALSYVALREVRYGEGDARSPMVATVAANLANVVLSLWFIFVLHWGVAGAAWATVIAHGVEVAVLVWLQGAPRVRGLRDSHLRALWKIGMPTGLQFSLEVGSFALLAALIAALSEVQMAAHQIALQVNHFSFLPAFAVAEAVSVLSGQAVGAGQAQMVARVARVGLWMAGIYTAACALVMGFGGGLVVSAFTSDPVLAGAAVKLLYVAAAFQVFDAANIVARGALRGAGDVKVPALIGVLSAWVFTPPLTWLLGYKAGLGALGGWLGLTGEIVVGSVILWVRLQRGTWQAASARMARERAALAAAAANDNQVEAELAEAS